MSAHEAGYAARLTLFAILSAIETDMRATLREYAVFDTSEADPYAEEQRKRLEERHYQYLGDEGDPPLNTFLLEYTDFWETFELLLRHRTILPSDAAKELMECKDQVSSLIAIRNRVMHSRPLDSDDFTTTFVVAQLLLRQKNVPWPGLRRTMDRISTEPSFVLSLRIPDYPWFRAESTPHNLPLPEFDDTGYIGRIKDREDVTKLILGHHQIVTILGEGGVGKTATLVKCLYDLLDSLKGRFDMVLWVSLKNQVLTAGGVKDVSNSISSTMGLYKAIAQPLGALEKDSIEALLSELRSHLEVFKVLLVIDNLETIQTTEIKDFIRDLPSHTKLVITSRIGLGELEFRRPLQPLNETEAAQLFRRYAQVHAVESLAKLPQPEVLRICTRLHHNPLAIRWFVGSIQRGAPAQSLLSHQDDLLSFCVKNVYEKLSDNAKIVLDIMLASRKPLGEAELAYLADKSAIAVRQQVFEISGTMMLRQIQQPLPDKTLETQYTLTDFSRQYFERHHRPSGAMMQKVATRLTELASSAEAAGMNAETDPYSPRAIRIRSNNDRVAARLLQIALAESHRKSYTRSLELITQAKDLAPTYSEVYKISAFIKAHNHDYLGAQTDYEQAIDLAPDSPQLYFLYAGYCAYQLKDSSRALDLIEKAHRLDSSNLMILAERARYLAFLGRFDEAWPIFESLLSCIRQQPIRFQIKTYDKSLNCLHRMMERAQYSRDHTEALRLTSFALSIIDEASDAFPFEASFSHSFCDIMHDIGHTANRLKDRELLEQVVLRFIEIGHTLALDKSFRHCLLLLIHGANTLKIDPAQRDSLMTLGSEHGFDLTHNQVTGIVVNVNSDGRSGHIRSDIDGLIYFFQFSHLSPHIKWCDLAVGAKVSFVATANRQGPLARYIDVIDY